MASSKARALANYIAAQIDASPKTQTEISKEAGFPHSNFLSMIRTGKSKVPIARVPALANALDVPHQDLLQRCLEAYYPEMDQILKFVIPAYGMTPDELMVLRGYREMKRLGLVGTDGVRISPIKKGAGRGSATIRAGALTLKES